MPVYSEKVEKAKEYPFPKVGKVAKEVEKRDSIPVINARIGIPDREAPRTVKEKLAKYVLEEKSTYGYPCDVHPERGIPELIDAIIQNYNEEHGVDLKPENIAVTSWSKETLHNLPRLYGDGHNTVFRNLLSGMLSLFDLKLCGNGNGVVSEPIYPAYESGVDFSDHRIRLIPTSKESGWLPNFKFEKNDTFLFFCDPNNPTGTVANESYYDELLDEMKRADVGGIFDKAYDGFIFDGEPAISITEISDLMNYGYEVRSLSKTGNFVGIGGGYIVSSKENIDRWFKLSDKFSQGVPWFIQKTMVEALTNPEVKREMNEYIKELRERRDIFAKGLNNLGLKCETPSATPYLFPEVPKDYDDESFVLDKLIGKAHVAAMPGSYFGKSGSGHVRFTLYVDKPKIVESLRRIKEVKDW